jgi:copper chaperone CopZ
MIKHELKIDGMSCNHCAMHVKKALEAIDGLEVESVEIGSARVWYDENAIKQKQIQEKIEEAGYTLVSVQ